MKIRNKKTKAVHEGLDLENGPICGAVIINPEEVEEIVSITCQDCKDLLGGFPLTNVIAADESDGVFFAVAHEMGEL